MTGSGDITACMGGEAAQSAGTCTITEQSGR